MESVLTFKQKRFVEEYLVDLNASAAARRAGYSPASAGKIGNQLLEKTRIKMEIELLKESRSEKVRITAEKVIEELAWIAFSDPKDFFQICGNDLQVNQTIFARPNLTKAISAVVIGKHGVSIHFHDRLKALELLLRHISNVPMDQSEARKAIFERLKTYMEKRSQQGA